MHVGPKYVDGVDIKTVMECRAYDDGSTDGMGMGCHLEISWAL
jgi:hypothetical protein